jgi:ATP-dependent DNA helicase 2 subunit 2
MVSYILNQAYKTAMSALIVGLDLLMKYCKKLKYIKNIFIITDGRGVTDWSQVDEIAQQINGENIKFSVLYVLCLYDPKLQRS